MSRFTDRILGAAKLDVATYEEVEADTSANGQALLVVVFSSVGAGLSFVAIEGLSGVFWGTVGEIIAWIILATTTSLVGTKILPEPQTQADIGELLRTIGFAASPGILRIFGIIPYTRFVVYLVVSLWFLAAVVVAVRQALDYKSTGRAVIVSLVGFVVYFAVAAARFWLSL